MNQSLLKRSYAALLAGAQKVCPSAFYNKKGYAVRWEDNLMNGLPLDEIKRDFKEGAGRELDVKLRAAHSSAALVVNTFGRWRAVPAPLTLRQITRFRSVQFEFSCPMGLRGTAPHLDLLAEGDDPVAVESKCTEWMTAKPPVFARSYDSLLTSRGDSPWFKQLQQLRVAPDRYRFLDAAQIIKHAFGLMNRFGIREVQLIYLYWEPRNHKSWPECSQHRNEVDDLAAKVKQSNVHLVSMSYRDLWREWERQPFSDHLPYLRARYDIEV